MSKILKVLGIILLVILLLFASFVGVLYFANKNMNPTIDNIDQILLEKPLNAKERLSFSKDDETMTILINKNDIYWYIANRYGKSLFNEIASAANENGIEIIGTGINIKTDGIYLDVVACPTEFQALKINISIKCILEKNDNTFDIIPTSVIAFGKEIPQAEQLGILGEPIVSFSYTPSLLYNIDTFELVDGGIKITGKMSVDYCGMARAGFTALQLDRMLEDERCNYSAKILRKYEDNVDEGKKLWMSYLEDNPELYPTILKQMLSMIKISGWANFYPELDNYGFIYRVVPDYDVNVYKSISNDLHDEYK